MLTIVLDCNTQYIMCKTSGNQYICNIYLSPSPNHMILYRIGNAGRFWETPMRSFGYIWCTISILCWWRLQATAKQTLVPFLYSSCQVGFKWSLKMVFYLLKGTFFQGIQNKWCVSQLQKYAVLLCDLEFQALNKVTNMKPRPT